MKNQLIHIGRIFLMSMLAWFGASAQTDPLQGLRNNAASDPGEKVFVHLSQSTVITGELLWYSVFVTDAQHHRPSELSSVAYAEVLNAGNKPILKDKIILKNGAGFGSFYLPASLPTGTYLFRAYTSWMKNADPEFYFHQEIKVVNTLRAPDSALESTAVQSFNMEFFPEGGYLVDGLRSRVGFKISNSTGRGVDASGVLLQGKDTLVTFLSKKSGLGDFYLTPELNAQYTVSVKTKDGASRIMTLPPIRERGLVMEVSAVNSEWYKVRIQSAKIPTALNYRMIIHSRSVLKLDRTFSLSSGLADIQFGKIILSEGINHLTIFDSEGHPILERLIFRQPDKNSFEIYAGQSTYNIRTRASISWTGIPDSLTRLSVSVFQADSLENESDIISWLYLSSDLHGQVESPAYYLQTTAEAQQLADMLMLTHGWRRFSWENVLHNKLPERRFLPELKSHLVSAKILDQDGHPVPGKTAYLSSPGKVIRLYTAMSDAQGRLFFEVKPSQLGGKLIIQPDRSDSLLRIIPEEPFSEVFKPWVPELWKLTNKNSPGLTQRSIDMQVQDIFREQETFFTAPPKAVDTTAFYGKPDERYLLDDYVRFPSMEEVFREFVKGVWVRKRDGKFRLMVLNKDANRMFDQQPVMLMDGVPVRDADQLFELDALKIRRIDVMSRKYFTGPLVTQGLISLSSYAGDMAGLQPGAGSAIIDLSGLEEKRIFHSPTYTTISSRESRLPDRRRLLLFDHEINGISESGKIEFFTSDVEGKYVVIVNGLTSSGTPLNAHGFFRVSR